MLHPAPPRDNALQKETDINIIVLHNLTQIWFFEKVVKKDNNINLWWSSKRKSAEKSFRMISEDL